MMYVLEEILNPWSKTYFQKENNLLEIKNKDAIALIIDDRPSKILRSTVLNTLLMCKLKVKIKIYTTSKEYQNMQKLFLDVKNHVMIEELKGFEVNDLNQTSYNKILKDKYFWSQIESAHIIIFQTDSLLIEPIDFSLFQYDYVGAPWVVEQFHANCPIFSDNLEKKIDSKTITTKINTFPSGIDNKKVIIGNGGLSIRNKEAMVEVCSRVKAIKDEAEDIYFSRSLPLIGGKLPPIEIAKEFACEGSYYKSIGMHKSYNYISSENQAEIYERHLINLTSIIFSIS